MQNDNPLNLRFSSRLLPQILEELKSRVDSLHGPLATVSTRPQKRIDPVMFLTMLTRGHQIKKIATYFNTTPQTLYNKFGDIIALCEMIRDDRILSAQDKKVIEGDTRMLIHLGKTVVGQSETINVNQGNDG